MGWRWIPFRRWLPEIRLSYDEKIGMKGNETGCGATLGCIHPDKMIYSRLRSLVISTGCLICGDDGDVFNASL